MATCKECEAQIPDESRFCWYCGVQCEPRSENLSASRLWLKRHAALVSVTIGVVMFGAIIGLVFLFWQDVLIFSFMAIGSIVAGG